MDWGAFSRDGGRGPPGARVRSALTAGLAIASAVLPLQAKAQQGTDTETAEARAVLLNPGSFIQIDDMVFGEVAQAGAGTIVLTPAASPTCNTTGGLIRTGPCQAASFAGDVYLLFLLRLTRPAGNQITLTGPGGATMRVSNFTFGAGSALLNLGSTATEQRYLVLSGDGQFLVYVGGTLHVAANQAAGIYQGTFQIQVNYN